MPAWQFRLTDGFGALALLPLVVFITLKYQQSRCFSKEQTLSRTAYFRKAFKDPRDFRDSSRYKHLITSYQPDGIWTESTIFREFGSPDPTIHKCNHGCLQQTCYCLITECADNTTQHNYLFNC